MPSSKAVSWHHRHCRLCSDFARLIGDADPPPAPKRRSPARKRRSAPHWNPGAERPAGKRVLLYTGGVCWSVVSALQDLA